MMRIDADGNVEIDDPAEQDFPPDDPPCPSCAAKDAEIARLREAVEFATRNNVGQVIDSEFARNVRKMAGMEG